MVKHVAAPLLEFLWRMLSMKDPPRQLLRTSTGDLGLVGDAGDGGDSSRMPLRICTARSGALGDEPRLAVWYGPAALLLLPSRKVASRDPVRAKLPLGEASTLPLGLTGGCGVVLMHE